MTMLSVPANNIMIRRSQVAKVSFANDAVHGGQTQKGRGSPMTVRKGREALLNVNSGLVHSLAPLQKGSWLQSWCKGWGSPVFEKRCQILARLHQSAAGN